MEDIITIEHVNKVLGGRQILKDVNLIIKSGDIFGYLGPNGAGKTTTIRIILGLMSPTSGSVSVLGRDVRDSASRKKVGFVLEADGLYDNMSALDNMAYYAQLYDVPDPSGKSVEILKLVGLGERAGDKAGTYSKGMRQRLALARAMVSDPDLLVLDEPTAGVDPTGQIEIRRLMLDMIHTQGKTILLSSHNLDEVQRICDRVALIHKGEIKLYGELDKLQRDMGKGGLEIETAEPVPQAVVAGLGKLPGISAVEQQDRMLTLSAGQDVDVSGLVAFLASQGARVEQFKKREASLEDLYTSIVKEAELK